MLQDEAIANLNLTLVQYYEKTLYELTIELKGYNARWEEQMRIMRKPYALLYNINAPKGQKKREWELIPLPSEAFEIAWQEEMRAIKDAARLRLAVEGKKNGGSGISS